MRMNQGPVAGAYQWRASRSSMARVAPADLCPRVRIMSALWRRWRSAAVIAGLAAVTVTAGSLPAAASSAAARPGQHRISPAAAAAKRRAEALAAARAKAIAAAQAAAIAAARADVIARVHSAEPPRSLGGTPVSAASARPAVPHLIARAQHAATGSVSSAAQVVAGLVLFFSGVLAGAQSLALMRRRRQRSPGGLVTAAGAAPDWPAAPVQTAAEIPPLLMAAPVQSTADIPPVPLASLVQTAAEIPPLPLASLVPTAAQDPPAPLVTAPSPALLIGVLGTFTINGAPAALKPAQSQLLLSLALNGDEGMSSARMCYLLGADPDHPKPGDSVRQLITRTRRQLGRPSEGREWIEHLGGGWYALHPDARFDWAEFEADSERGIREGDRAALSGALALVRGEPFRDCDWWWLDQAFLQAIGAQITETAVTLAELELAAGGGRAAAHAARVGLGIDPADERLWRALMRAEHEAGRPAGVQDAWDACQAALADIALDGQPHQDTAALHRELTAYPSGDVAATA
jgi:DNA-binding SARP family transcriptional activator